MSASAALLAGLLALPAAAEGGRASPALVPAGGLLVFYDSQGPLSLVAATRRELPAGAVDAGEVEAEACQHGLSVPLSLSWNATSVSGAYGRGGYEKALARLKARRPELKGIYDARVDLRVTSLLGVWRRLCVEVAARGFR